MASQFTTILNAVTATVNGLGLTYGSGPITAAVRKLPRAEETLDSPPLICVCLRGPERVYPFTTEDLVEKVYDVETVLVAPGERDFTDTNLDAWLTVREKVCRLFQWQLPGVDTILAVDVLPEAPLDRSLLNSNYEYSSIGFAFHNIESRT